MPIGRGFAPVFGKLRRTQGKRLAADYESNGPMQACCTDVFQRPKVMGCLGETPDKRRLALGREPRMVLYATDVHVSDLTP